MLFREMIVFALIIIRNRQIHFVRKILSLRVTAGGTHNLHRALNSKVNHNTNHSSLPTYLVTYKTTSCHSEHLLNKHTRPSFFKLHSPLYHHHPRNTFTGKNFPVIHIVHSIWSLEHRAASAGNKVRTSVKQPNIRPLAHSLCHMLPFPSLRALRQHTTRLPTWVLSVRMAS
jgi:hypothetical protein